MEKNHSQSLIEFDGGILTTDIFDPLLKTTNYKDPKTGKEWISDGYLMSLKDYKKGIDDANNHHMPEKQILHDLAKRYITGFTTLMNLASSLSPSQTNFSAYLFGQDYCLNLDLSKQNEYMLNIFSLSQVAASYHRLPDELDSARYLFDLLSIQNEIDSNTTQIMLNSYLDELIKLITDPKYQSPMINKITKGINDQNELTQLGEVDFKAINGISCLGKDDRQTLLDQSAKGIGAQKRLLKIITLKDITDALVPSIGDK